MRWGTVLGLAALASLFVIPFVASSFWTYLLSEVVIWAFVAISFNLVYSYANILSFAQGSLFGFAAYAVAILNSRCEWPLAMAIPVAVASTVAVGSALGFVFVRLSRHNATVATVVTAVVGTLTGNYLKNYTGGENGLTLVANTVQVGPFSLAVGANNAMLFLGAVVLTVIILGTWGLEYTKLGLLLRAARQNAIRIETLGFNVGLYRFLTFAAAAGIAALGGCLYALTMSYVTTSSLDISLSVNAILWSVLGGIGTAFGSLVGTIIVVPLTQILGVNAVYANMMVGLLLIIVTIFFADGIIGTLNATALRLRARKAASATKERTTALI